MFVIQFEDVRYVYFPNTPFEKLALEVPRLQLDTSEYYGIIGPTGSGKSTFLKVLTHLMECSSGSITVDDSVGDIREYFGFVFQQPEHQLFCETVKEEIEFSLSNFGIDKSCWSEKVSRALNLVGLSSEFLLKDPIILSGGEKRRVAIASIMAYEPKVLVLDEPTAGVDGMSKKILLEAFRNYHNQGHCIFLVSHDMNIINNECSKALAFADGKLENIGKAFEVILKSGVKLTPALKTLKKLYLLDPSVDTAINSDNFKKLGEVYA